MIFVSDCFGFWICFRGSKNKKQVSFYFGLFTGLGGKTTPQSYMIFVSDCFGFWICF